jgi:predicted membrane protein
MKKLKLFYLTFIIALSVNAQEYTHSLKGIEWVKIESMANVTVKTHSSSQLLIKAGHHFEAPKKAKGLKLVGEDGTDNTDVGFYVIKEGNNLIVRNLRKSESAEIYLPASQNISVITNWSGDIKIFDFLGEIEASAKLNGGVIVKNVSGPLTANSLNGEVKVTFTKVSQNSPITIFSTNGELDITLPENTPADFSLGSINGSIYTNFELKIPNKNGLRAIASKKVRGSINNGGVKIQLNTTNGNIYLRKP